MKILIKIFLLTFILLQTISSQINDPDVILKKVIDSFNKVQDYKVNVKIKVDVDFLKVPDAEAKIYFKQPDKVHFESETLHYCRVKDLIFHQVHCLRKSIPLFM
jgi:hypothetical protein